LGKYQAKEGVSTWYRSGIRGGKEEHKLIRLAATRGKKEHPGKVIVLWWYGGQRSESKKASADLHGSGDHLISMFL